MHQNQAGRHFSVISTTFKRRSLLSAFISGIILLATVERATAQISFSTTSLPSGMDFVPSSAGVLQTPDINQDGLPDIIYVTSAGGAITYLQNNGGSSFSTPSPNPFSAYTSSSPTGFITNSSMSTADFDGDGDLDIWVRVMGAANDVYLRNDNGTYVTGSVLSGMEFTAGATTNVQIPDVNKDGLVDIIYITAANGPITYLQNNGGSSFSTPSPNPFSNYTVSTPTGFLLGTTCSVADYDGDGDIDIWVRVHGTANDVYLQNVNGTYATTALPTGLEFTPTGGSGATQVADFNGDGLVDVLYQTAASGPLVYLQNSNGSTFSTPTPNPFSSYLVSLPTGITMNSASSVGDFNGDGDFDLWIRQAGAANDFYSMPSGAAPDFSSTLPANSATGVDINVNIVLNFTENVFVGSGSFFIRKLSDNSIVETIPANGAAVSGSGTSTITINPVASLAPGTSFYVTYDRRALADADGLIPGHADNVLKLRVPESGSDFLSFTTAGTLPVVLSSFSANLNNGQTVLEWQTSSEINSNRFDIQYSTNGINWINIGSVAAAGNSSSETHYEFIHPSPSKGNNYYRLAQIDIDGKTELSDIKLVKYADKNSFDIFPNPTRGNAYVRFSEAALTTVVVYDMTGKMLYRKDQNAAQFELPLANQPTGIYKISISRNGERVSKTIMVE